MMREIAKDAVDTPSPILSLYPWWQGTKYHQAWLISLCKAWSLPALKAALGKPPIPCLGRLEVREIQLNEE